MSERERRGVVRREREHRACGQKQTPLAYHFCRLFSLRCPFPRARTCACAAFAWSYALHAWLRSVGKCEFTASFCAGVFEPRGEEQSEFCCLTHHRRTSRPPGAKAAQERNRATRRVRAW